MKICSAIVMSLVLTALPAVPVLADDLRDLCPDRPGLGTPTCTIDRGHAMVETGLADWTRDSGQGTRTDTATFGETLIRYGLTDTLEMHIGWDGYSTVRQQDRVARPTEHIDGGGDMTLALRQNLRNPDGSGFSYAVMPYVTLPTGADGIGAGDWSAGLIAPVSYELRKGLTVALTPEIDAAADSDGDGRHLGFGSVIGLGVSLTDKIAMTLETSLYRDQDPDGHSTIALAGLAFAWQPKDDLQFDIGAVAGLNSDCPDVEVYGGVARRF